MIPAVTELSAPYVDILPVHQSGEKVKRPACPAWHKPLDPQPIIPDGDCYGVPTGRRNGFWTLDLDVKNGKSGPAYLSRYIVENGLEDLPETRTVRTPSGGFHLDFTLPEGRLISTGKEMFEKTSGIDWRGEGGYVCRGGPYTVMQDVPLADAPEWLLALVEKKEAPPAVSAVAISPEHPEFQDRGRRAKAFLESEPPCIAGQGGDAQLLKVCLRLARTYEFPHEASLELLAPYNERCEPPWSREEMLRKLVYAAEKGTGPTGCAPQGFSLGSTSAKRSELQSANDTALPGVLERPDADARAEPGNDPPKTYFARGDHAELVDELIRTCGSRLVTSEGAIWAYDSAHGVWSADGVERRLKKTILERFAGVPTGPSSKPKCINNADVEGVIRSLKTLTEDVDFFASAPAGIACENGFVTLDGVVPHDHAHRARTHYPLTFVAEALSEPWERFLDDLFRDDPDKTEKVSCLQEFFGGALFGLSTRYQKCIVATGEGANGKSTLFSIIRAMFPVGKVQAIPPKKWEHAFTLANFRGALLNLVSDMPHGAIIDSEHFKEVVAGDAVTAEEKHKPAFPLRPVAGHAFSCNDLPATSDHSFGFWRRFAVVEFRRNFELDANRDLTIADRLIANERAGILAWLVAGARRLAAKPAREGYTVPASHAKALSKWQAEANTVKLFALECLRPVKTKGIEASRLYRLYHNWAQLSGFKPVARPQFGKRMAALGHPSEKKEEGLRYSVACSHAEAEVTYRAAR